VDYGIESGLRLRRADLDRFERSLTRRRRLRVFMVPLLIAALAGGGYYYYAVRAGRPQDAEREPNDHIESATLISPNVAVTAKLGQRISRTEPDRDFFRLAAKDTDQTATITVQVTALPNVDVDVYLYTIDGKLLARANEGSVGESEWIRRYRVSKPVALLVTEAKLQEALPTENVSDSYTVTARFAPADPRLESEPNETLPDAVVLTAGTPITGHIDRRTDVDCFRFDGEAGNYALTLSGAEAVPLVWRVGAGEPRHDRKATMRLEPGAIIKLERADSGHPVGQPLPGTDEPYTIDVTRAP
jgi:hypothetical protein